MKKLLLFLFALTLGMAQDAWAQGVNYIERSWNQATKTIKSETKTCSKYKDFSTLSDNKGARGIGDGYGADFKWVVLKKSQSIKQLVVQGEAHLILCDGAQRLQRCHPGSRTFALHLQPARVGHRRGTGQTNGDTRH